MTSQRNSFRMIVELDKKSVDEVNRRLKALGTVGAGRAMKNGFRRWSSIARKTVAAGAPMGRMTGTETIRGQVRPNVHLKFNVATKIKGYSKGLVVWAAIGIKDFGKLLGLVASASPIRRNVTIEDVGNVAAFLLSDLASGVTAESVA